MLRWLVLAAFLAVIGVFVGWRLFRAPTDEAKPHGGGPAEAIGSAELAPTPGSAKAAVAGRTAPALPDRPQLPAEVAFAAQPRDDDWAPPTEAEIRTRFGKIRGGKLRDVTCHQSQCRVTVEGTVTDVQKTIADLESERGLHGYAQSLLLTAPERRADGTVVLNAFALFER